MANDSGCQEPAGTSDRPTSSSPRAGQCMLGPSQLRARCSNVLHLVTRHVPSAILQDEHMSNSECLHNIHALCSACPLAPLLCCTPTISLRNHTPPPDHPTYLKLSKIDHKQPCHLPQLLLICRCIGPGARGQQQLRWHTRAGGGHLQVEDWQRCAGGCCQLACRRRGMEGPGLGGGTAAQLAQQAQHSTAWNCRMELPSWRCLA